jgi:hypothetical protein
VSAVVQSVGICSQKEMDASRCLIIYDGKGHYRECALIWIFCFVPMTT